MIVMSFSDHCVGTINNINPIVTPENSTCTLKNKNPMVTTDDPICSPKNIIIINGEITEDRYLNFKKQYEELNLNSLSMLDIFIRTTGGSIYYQREIMTLIDEHLGLINCYVNGYALSAGTEILLHCDRIYMEPENNISPIDPLIDRKRVLLELSDPATIYHSNPIYFRLLTEIQYINLIWLQKIPRLRRMEMYDFNKFIKLFYDKDVDHQTHYKAIILKNIFPNVVINYYDSDINDIIYDKYRTKSMSYSSWPLFKVNKHGA